ncbi:MAG: hypothetical protein IKP73_22110 [Bacteroidales bacterium]|nr:hypothetical protein [Bacteroidales bacterium]
MKKIDKEFCISDDSVNVYGYRLLTSGLDLSRFNPPIGFLMHERERGVAVRWEDFRTEVGKVYAKPVVNDELFPTLASQIEEGFYNAASVGHIVALEMDDSDGMKLEGQTGPTVTKWFCRECSIVDIPGNYNAIARLYDESDNVLHDLSANLINTDTMKQDNPTTGVMVAVAALGLPDLKEGATAEDAVLAVQELMKKNSEREKLIADLTAQVAAQKDASINAILDNAVKARKMTPAMAAQLKSDYAGRTAELQELIDKMPVQGLLTEQLKPGDVPEKWLGKTWHDLYVSGELEQVKREFPDYYERLREKRG